jgi:hypothetical protein
MKDEVVHFKREMKKMEQLLDSERSIHRESMEKLYLLEKQSKVINFIIYNPRRANDNHKGKFTLIALFTKT